MKFKRVARLVEGTPHISTHSARVLYDFILTEKPERCLELGFAHGASSAYIAAALDELGRGQLTSVDLEASAEFRPTMEDTLALVGLESRVSIHREVNSYNWFLKKEIERLSENGACEPIYDFVFIDGSKNWTIDGFAFFLADKLLRPGGWILFDDYDWRYTKSVEKGRDGSDGVSTRHMSPDQIEQPNVAAIFHLLVAQHPDYSNFKVQDRSWAWAQKVAGERSVAFTRKSRLKSRLARFSSRLGS